MAPGASSSLIKNLSKDSSVFGIRLWILIVALFALFLLLIILLLSFYLFIVFLRRRKSYMSHHRLSKILITQERNQRVGFGSSSLDRRLLSGSLSDIEMSLSKPEFQLLYSNRWTGIIPSGAMLYEESSVRDLEAGVACDTWRRGNRFSLKEIEAATNGFTAESVVAGGDNGVIYRGVLLNNTRVAVKRLLSDRSQAEAEDFIREVENFGHIKHKNLVNLLGYCVEANNRMLVYEYIDNGNLYQWLHGCLAEKPLNWETRMKIIQGIAKGLAYLHEDLEPEIVHRNIKSSSILLDHQWNPKISGVGLAQLHSYQWNHLSPRPMEESRYVDQMYASPGNLNENSDIYSFGVLIMEIVSGKLPVDDTQPQVYLIDWLKSMVADHKIEYVLDPKLPEYPSLKEFKRIILISLRCVDPDVEHRPKMGDIIHMLEPHDLLLN